MGARPTLRPARPLARRGRHGERAARTDDRAAAPEQGADSHLGRDAWPRYLEVPRRAATIPTPPLPAAGEALAERAAPPPEATAAPAPAAPPSLPAPPTVAHPPAALQRPPSPAAAAVAPPGEAARQAAQQGGADEASGGGEEAQAGDTGRAEGGGAGGAGRLEGAAEAQAGGEADAQTLSDPLPAELQALDSEPVAAPPLQWQPLAGDWPLTGELEAEALPRSPRTGSAQPGKAPPGEQPGSTDKGATPAAAAQGADDPQEVQRQTRAAADLARRAWQELASTARREQEAFVARANRTADAMARSHVGHDQNIEHALEADLAALDVAADQAAEQVRNAADLARLQLDAASRGARAAINRAGRNAYGLINSGATRATGQIAQVVAGLVAGHNGAYNDAIASAREAADAALLALSEWRDLRASNYPISGAGAMAGAKNESLQARIPRWADPEATRLEQRIDQKTQAWTSSRDSTVCSLTCSYRGALEAENCSAAGQARQAVANALDEARATLRRQTREGRQALDEMRLSSLRQIATQQRATKSRLTSQTRGTLGGLRGEAQGAIKGVQGAAGAAIPGYWRGADGLRQSLRKVADQGAAAVSQTARQGPDSILQSLRRSSATLDERLDGNRAQLESGLAERARGHHQASEEHQRQLLLALLEQGGTAGEQFDQASAGFVAAFSGLADTVLQAAAAWAQPAAVRMAASIQTKRGEAQQALQGLLNGQPASSGAGGGAAQGGGAAEGSAEGCAAATCGTCADGEGGGEGGGEAAAGGEGGPQGLLAQVDEEVAYCDERLIPELLFSAPISTSDGQVEEGLRRRAVNVAQKFAGGFAGTVDEAGVIANLRGLTEAKGRALDRDSYPTATSRGTLDADLRHYLGADSGDYATASAYLSGDAVEGARRELADSTGFFNDDEARIEATMRALSPEQSRALGRAHPEVMADIRDALGGTDLEVFNALAAGNHARADAYRLRAAVDAARRDGNADAVHSAIEQHTGAPQEGDWRAAEEVGAEENRAAVVRELGGIVGEVAGATSTDANGRPLSADQLAVERAVAYVSRDIEVYVGGGPEGEPQTVTLRLQGANRDLAGALLRHGPDSVQTRVARLGVELQRRGDRPNPLNLDRAMFDPRFTPDSPNAGPEEIQANERARAAATADRERVLLLAAQTYAGDSERLGASVDPTAVMAEDFQADAGQVGDARRALIDRMGARFGSDTLGAQLAAGLLTDERPSPRTAALAMRHAQAGAGTNEELIFRFTERMTREEIAAMRTTYQQQTGRSLDADLGTYGEGGTFTELSGDDRLRMERALRGVARTDQERIENAAFAIAQQRRETGAFGAWLAEGSLAEQVMNNTEGQLQALAGGPIRFNQHGELTTTLANFGATGAYTGTDRDHFRATTAVAQTVAENYSRRIDAYADIATTGIAVLGAIAAAVITVVTGGAAAPLIAAALIAGLASMGANYAIKGGRYGWEQAAIDLGMTAVQALTAGVGAQLGAAAQIASKGAAAASTASRSLVTLSRLFTGNPVVDQIIVGAITGSIGGLGGAAFDERTWEHGSGDAVSALFAGLLKGALSGATTAAVTNSVEALGRNGQVISARARALAAESGLGRRAVGLAGRGLGRAASGLDEALNAASGGGAARTASAMLRRGLARGAVSGLGGMAGRGSEIAVDAARGRFKGDAGDALLEMGQAGLHAFVQGIGEGAGEAHGQGLRTRRLDAAAEGIARHRAERGLEPLDRPALHAAADDLLFLNQHGRNGGDGLGRALNLEHIAIHGGLAATLATRNPEPFVEDGMRAALLRHVPADQRGDFANVPIKVMAEAEYYALTRSQSGPVATLIDNGRPVVVIRAGTAIARLADEGPHLQQTRAAATRERAARLDEATLARWDSLDLDTQLDLYQTKIELEIDAHQRIADSLAGERGRAGGDAAHLAAEMERNAATLSNLRARLAEVEAIGPTRRGAIAAGDAARPQYLEQPARLFSKEGRPPAEAEAAVVPHRHAEQPDLRAPRLAGEPGSEAALRQRHEDWMENLRRGHLDPGSQPPMAEGAAPTRFMSLHDDVASAYAAYDATVRQHGGSREVGIVRDALSGRYMVVLGSPTSIRYPNELARPETMLHYHPDYGPSLYRGPSAIDLHSAAATAYATRRPATEFIEYDVPGVGRSRTAFTLTPIADAAAPGGMRMRIDIEYVDPGTGRYVHQRFASHQEWSAHYHSRTTFLDPDGPVYRAMMRGLRLTEAQIDTAAGHRPPGAPPPPAAEPAAPGRPRQAIVETEPPARPAGVREADIEAARLAEIGEKRRMAARGGLVEADYQDLPEAAPAYLRRREHLPGRGATPQAVQAWARRAARARFGRLLQEALLDPGRHTALTQASMERLNPDQLDFVARTGRLPPEVEFHHLLAVADFPEFAHLAEAGLGLPKDVHREAGHGGDTTRPVEAATFIEPEAESRPIGQHLDPEARKHARPSAREIAAGSRSRGDVDRDLVIDFRQRLRRATGEARRLDDIAARRPTARNLQRRDAARARVEAARAHLAEVEARIANHAAMRAQLLRHVPVAQRTQYADTPIRILPQAEYRALTRSDAGPVVTLIIDGQPQVVVRAGTPPARLADEGPHLMQSRERAADVGRLDEARLAHWDSLDLDTQLDLYHTKIGLEIDAHQRIQASLEAERAGGGGDPAQLAAELTRNAVTLSNLRQRQAEVAALGPAERANMTRGAQARPDWLAQPPRLFSKDAPMAQRFAVELAEFPQLQAAWLALGQIADPARRAAAGAQLHARLIAMRHLANLASGHRAAGTDFSLMQLRGVAAQHNLPEAEVIRHVRELLDSGHHPPRVEPAGAYGRHLLRLAEALAGPRPAAPPRLILPLPEAPAQAVAAAPEAAAELSPADRKRAERMAKAAADLPDMLRALGVDAALLVGASRGDLLNIYNALDGDPIAKAAGKGGGGSATPWRPTALQRDVARWALANANGDAVEFHALYEYARARYSALRATAEQQLKGTPDYRNQAAIRAGTELTEAFLNRALQQDLLEIAQHPGGQDLHGPTTGMAPEAIARAVQALQQFRFRTPSLEAYHAWKHHKEIPAGFSGTLIGRYRAAVMETVRSGTVRFAAPALPPDPATRIIIHKAFGQPPTEVVKEAILRVEPDGRVTISSWGDPKAIKP